MSILSNMVKDMIKVFMDDFSMVGDSFNDCLAHLASVLQRYEECNLVLNWKKCHFMVREVIVLGHKIFKHGIRVDKAKIKVIENFSPPVLVRGILSFLNYAGFYRRFIKDFSKLQIIYASF